MLKFENQDSKVVMVKPDGTRSPFCTMSPTLLTPKLAALEVAEALNKKYDK